MKISNIILQLHFLLRLPRGQEAISRHYLILLARNFNPGLKTVYIVNKLIDINLGTSICRTMTSNFQNLSNHNLTALWPSMVINDHIKYQSIRIEHILNPDKIVVLKSVNHNVSFMLKISMSLVFCTVAVFPLKSTHQKRQRHVQTPAALLFTFAPNSNLLTVLYTFKGTSIIKCGIVY